MNYLWLWITQLLSGRPHFIIGGEDNPYLLRWYLIPRNRFLNVYLHKFLRDDDDRALHDHPWWFASLMIYGEYWEITDDHPWPGKLRRSGSLAFRLAAHRHRVELSPSPTGMRLPCWTIVVTGRKVRDWGFWCPQGFVPWQKFVDRNDHGGVGPGCEGDE